jgi:PPK2 family polyphosphate:nucleotide phosphotransferase
MPMQLQPILVQSAKGFKLADIDPRDTCSYAGDKAATVAHLAELNARLAALQDVLYAEHRQRILIVLQAMDTGGKDGCIRKLLTGINPQGVRITSFKAPTPAELDRDYLWRIHAHTPAKGEIAVFNRSHYEDVLITRVHEWISPKQCERRYAHIRDFERMLIEEGVTVIKFFLHISKDEQKQRLQDRLDDPAKKWKFNVGDLAERKHWDAYMAAYEAALGATATPDAPWYVVPADRKWLRDVYVASVVVARLEALNMQYPAPADGLDKVKIR